MRKSQKWGPIVFTDSEGRAIAAFSPNALNGVLQGMMVPKSNPAPTGG
jgi:hypothetical protein